MQNIHSYRKINILPDYIANQIAAGEVIQRPESVIKELVENSLDAGADSIIVVVRDAGKQLIHIVDNGCGMARPDLELSCKRHTTSKIFTSEDLEEILTFGFRGEALASICSIANVEIRTKRRSNEEEFQGYRLISEPMKEEFIEPFNSDFGTQIFVRNLFFNVPARRKFLKSNLTEFRYISDTMIRLALSKPDIRFTFYDEDNLIFDVKPSTLKERIAAILGRDVADNMFYIQAENDLIKLSGFIGNPANVKRTTANQYFFLNGRNIKSKSLNFAVFSGYEHILEKNNFPFYLINIDIDPKFVDVNVHPQKHEVKFEDERIVFNLLQNAVAKVLQENNLLRTIDVMSNEASSPFIAINPQNQSTPTFVNRLTGEIVSNQRQFDFPKRYDNFDYRNKEQFSTSAYSALFSNNPNTENELIEKDAFPKSMLFQIHYKYIISQTFNGFIIIDQHAAHERILYERALNTIKKIINNSQQLLFPVQIQFSPAERTIFKLIEEELSLIGFGFKFLDDSTVELISVPVDIKPGKEEISIKEILQQYEEYEKVMKTDKQDLVAASFACKAAIKTGQQLSQEEMKNLLDDLNNCDNPNSCPHGRPIIIEFPLIELDRRFGRS
ncbi:MAG TPA: DNA mismatch repair endonuclease MutL [Candidatus Kapabacteria bacterium]|nr:DNA mismatch repair endonuclease MutL [Candidatus Kapabacteria bacterium]HPO63918.1 DNA mismatch repair endonuclease MutL [Candidatus Kapabacteria bacterium]